MKFNDKYQIDEESYNVKFAKRARVIKSIVFIIILIITIFIILIVLYLIAQYVGYVYSIMIDAGSTSSKISILRWRDWPFRSNGWVEELKLVKFSPGISSYSKNPFQAFTNMKTNLNTLMSTYIPENKRSKTAIYLGATAGMRMLKLESPLESEAILDDLRRNLPTIGVRLRNAYSDVRIISGSFEGRFAWVSTNYLAKKFGTENGLPPVSGEETIGALDLGGASTQIAFVPTSVTSGPHIEPISLFGQTYNLYSYSYLCYGVEMAKKRVWADIINSEYKISTPVPPNVKIINPCLPTNYKMKVKKSELFVEPCVISKFAEKLVGSQIIPPDKLPEEITFIGSWKYDKCHIYINKLFNKVACENSPCIFKGIYRPELNGKFYAMSAFWFIFEFLGFPKSIHTVTAQDFENKLKLKCINEWDAMKTKYDSKDFDFVSQNCFVGIYVHQLLINYGFSDDTKWKSITFVKKVAGGSVSWALGYVIDATGDIDSLSPKIRLPYPTFSVIIAIFSIVLIAALICLFLSKFKYSHKTDETNFQF